MFNHVKKGYSPAEVEDYIRRLETELKVYKDKDATIHQAIISAQVAADNIVRNAKNQGRVIRENIAKQLDDVSLSIAAQKQMLANFVEDYNLMISKYLKVVDNEDFKNISEKVDSMAAYLQNFREEIDEDLEMEKKARTVPVEDADN